MNTDLNHIDYIVIALYFVLIAAIIGYLLLKERRKSKEASSEYFLGGRSLGWFVVGASLFASNIGSEHLIGLAGAGASGDFPVANFEILASFLLLLLGWLFVPLYLKSGVFTMPEFLEKRYDKWAKNYLVAISVAGYVMTKISVTIAAGGIIFTSILGIDFWYGAIAIVIITGLYTAVGGLKAVVYTDTFQLFVLIGGTLALSYYGLEQGGGWGTLKQHLPDSYTHLWRPSSDKNFPWTGIVLGAPILGVWYWCTDQFIVQRVLSAKNVDTARKGTLFASYLKLLPLFLFVIPGVLAYALAQSQPELFAFPVENGKVMYDAALPLLTKHVLPNGLKGLMVAGLLAALMSSLSSVFNSCSTLVTMDIYKPRNPKSSEKQLVKVGQISTVILVVLGLAWIPLLNLLEGGLFQKIQSIQSYISPPIAAIFLIGILDKRITAKGAKWSLIVGGVIGMVKLLFELNQSTLSGIPLSIAEFNFLHFAFALFVICAFTLYAVSLSASPRVLASKNFSITLQEIPKQKTLAQAFTLILFILIAIIWYVF